MTSPNFEELKPWQQKLVLENYFADQSWVESWTKPMPANVVEEGRQWMRERPDCIKELMIKFPPSCVVKAVRTLVCPSPGRVGIVSSYFEDGLISVRSTPDGDTNHQCNSEWLEVVGYRQGITPKVVKEILKND